VKSGGNYASALGLILAAKEKYNTAQVIFAPDGDVQETGAANCLLINDTEVLTKPLSSEFLPGITRDSLLQVAAKLGYKVTERNIQATELIEWIKTGEVALSGTAAVLAPIGEVVYEGETHHVKQGGEPVNAKRLRKYLNDVQQGLEEDSFGWITRV
jgi:branched-chain amino acid aminotransferase